MDLQSIRDHLRLARCTLGEEHPLSPRIAKVERNLTPGDPLFRDDAVSAERDLLAISTELEQSLSAGTPGRANEAIKHLADAIELL